MLEDGEDFGRALVTAAQRDVWRRGGAADAEASRMVADACGQDANFVDLYRSMQVCRAGPTPGSSNSLRSPSGEQIRVFDGGRLARKPQPTGAAAEPRAPEV